MKNQNYGENTAGACTKQAEKTLWKPKNIGMADKKRQIEQKFLTNFPLKAQKLSQQNEKKILKNRKQSRTKQKSLPDRNEKHPNCLQEPQKISRWNE